MLTFSTGLFRPRVFAFSTGVHTSLGSSLRDVLDVDGEDPSLELLPNLRAQAESPTAKQHARDRATIVLASIGAELTGAPWFDDGWLERTIDGAARELDPACQSGTQVVGNLFGDAWTERFLHDHPRFSAFGNPRRKTSARTMASLCSVSRAE